MYKNLTFSFSFHSCLQKHSLAFLVLFVVAILSEDCNVQHGSGIFIMRRTEELGEIKVCLALSLGVSTAVVLALTWRGGNGVEILHDALQVLHLVVQLLRAVTVAGLKYQVSS